MKILYITFLILLSGFLLPKEEFTNALDLSSLDINLPQNMYLDTEDPSMYYFYENNIKVGSIFSHKYSDSYDYKNIKRNHSSLINEETIYLQVGKCNLYTLDVDNGTAASGKTGTHLEYRAIIKVKEKIIYVLFFSKLDKRLETKNEFINILKNLTLKVPI